MSQQTVNVEQDWKTDISHCIPHFSWSRRVPYYLHFIRTEIRHRKAERVVNSRSNAAKMFSLDKVVTRVQRKHHRNESTITMVQFHIRIVCDEDIFCCFIIFVFVVPCLHEHLGIGKWIFQYHVLYTHSPFCPRTSNAFIVLYSYHLHIRGSVLAQATRTQFRTYTNITHM